MHLNYSGMEFSSVFGPLYYITFRILSFFGRIYWSECSGFELSVPPSPPVGGYGGQGEVLVCNLFIQCVFHCLICACTYFFGLIQKSTKNFNPTTGGRSRQKYAAHRSLQPHAPASSRAQRIFVGPSRLQKSVFFEAEPGFLFSFGFAWLECKNFS